MGTRWWLLLAMLVALALRVADFPGRYEMRNTDERPYTQGGLALWEGITPTYKYSPAGPMTWVSWAYAGAESARHFILPGPEERVVPFVLRPFQAVNHALFDIYHDWSRLRQIQSLLNVLTALAAVWAGFMLGFKRGGLPVALIVGGLTAAMPLFVHMSVEARPYMMGWGLGLIALYLSAEGRATASAVVMGLAIGTRIDMLVLLPLAYADLWPGIHPGAKALPRVRRLIRYTLVTAMASLLIAPWLLTNLLGNLRTIATVRVAEPNGVSASLADTIRECVVHQGLGVPIVLAVAALMLAPPGRKRPRWIAAVYVLLLAASMLKATHFGLQHQGGPIVALIAFASVGASAVAARWRALAWVLVAFALLPPLISSGNDIAARRGTYVPSYATEWLEQHVPPGTRVYLSPSFHDPLPTVEASNALWAEVTENNSWELKVRSGMARFHISAETLPRALSEENMIIERGLRREWFILGSRPNLPEPRFDIRVFSASVVYGEQNIEEAFNRTGGVLVWAGIMPTNLGRLVAQWISPAGIGVRIYCSPDVKLMEPGD
jgi:hypothetical protein